MLWTERVNPPRCSPVAVEVVAGCPDPLGLDYSAVRVHRVQHGHARGVVRHLEIDVPTGVAAPVVGGPATIRAWTRTPFTQTQMLECYGSFGCFETEVRRVADDLVAQESLLSEHRTASVAGAIRAAAR